MVIAPILSRMPDVVIISVPSCVSLARQLLFLSEMYIFPFFYILSVRLDKRKIGLSMKFMCVWNIRRFFSLQNVSWTEESVLIFMHNWRGSCNILFVETFFSLDFSPEKKLFVTFIHAGPWVLLFSKRISCWQIKNWNLLAKVFATFYPSSVYF